MNPFKAIQLGYLLLVALLISAMRPSFAEDNDQGGQDYLYTADNAGVYRTCSDLAYGPLGAGANGVEIPSTFAMFVRPIECPTPTVRVTTT